MSELWKTDELDKNMLYNQHVNENWINKHI